MGIFDNATSITIGYKEVKSIKIGEATLYEKEDEEGTTTVTVTIKNGSGNPVNDLTVALSNASTGSREYYVDSGTDGEYVFANIPYKEYRLSTTRYGECVSTELNNDSNFTCQRNITVSKNSNSWLLKTI